jgi:hypothetical protein
MVGITELFAALWLAMGGMKSLTKLLKISAFIGALLLVLYVFGLLVKKFGTWQAALAAWASAIALAIAMVFQFVLDGLLTLVKVVTTALIGLISLLASLAIAAGFDKIGNSMNKLARKASQFQASVQVPDLVGGTAKFLDDSSFFGQTMNPQPVTITQNNETNIEGVTDMDEIMKGVEETKQDFADRLGMGAYTTE